MGLLSSIGSGLKSAVKAVDKALVSAGTTIKQNEQRAIETVKAAVTGQGVQSNTGVKVVDKVLSTVASNPFAVAAVVATAKVPSALKTNIGTVATTVVATPIISNVIVSNPQGTSRAVGNVLGGTKDLSNYGTNLGVLTKDPSLDNATKLFKENPFLTTATVGAVGYVAGKGVTNLFSSFLNTAATNANTDAINNSVNPPAPVVMPDDSGGKKPPKKTKDDTPVVQPDTPVGGSPIPLTPATQVVGRSVSTTSTHKRHVKTVTPNRSTQSLRVNIYNQSKVLNSSSTKRYYGR